MLSRAYQWILLAPAFLALFYVEGVMYPLIAPKTFALRTCAFIAVALFAYLIASRTSFFWHRLYRAWTWIPGILLVIAYGTSYIGVDFYHSFWSTFERGDGLLTLTACVAYFYLILLMADEAFVERFVRITAWVGSLTALYAIFQWIVVTSGIGTSLFVPANGRVGGTMGNAAFLAAYLGMSFFISGIAREYYRGTRRTYVHIGMGLQLLAILVSATRGTLVACAMVAIIALVYQAWKGTGVVRVYAQRGLAVFLIGIALMYAYREVLSQVPFDPIRRVASISLSDPTVSSRLFIWSNVLSETKERLLTGYGAEHIDMVFSRIYDPSALVEEWFDRSHNAYLDYLVQFGVFGLLAYIGLLGIIVRGGYRLFKHGDVFGFWVLGFIGVYAIQNFFVFDTAVTFWFLLAVCAIVLVRQEVGKRSVLFSRTPGLFRLVSVGLLMLIIPVSIAPIRANLKAFEAYQYQIVDVARSKAAFEKGLSLDTYANLEYGYNAYFMYTDSQIFRLSGEERATAYRTAAAMLEQAYNQYPYDARTALYFAQVLSSAPSGAVVDNELLSGALARVLALSPKRSQAWFILANVAIADANTFPPGSVGRKKGYASAEDILTRYMAMVPGLAEPHFVLAQLKLAMDNRVDAAKEAERGKELYKSSEKTARRAVAYYGSVGNLEETKFFLEEIITYNPRDYASRFDLAKVRYVLGDRAAALDIVKALRIEQSDILKTDPDFMSAIVEYEKTIQ